jgi:transcriptional regulator with XRE-family HTH domain
MAKKRSYKLSDQLRQAIDDSGLSRYAISQETGIDQAALSRFVHGHVGLSLDAIDRISECLQLTITMGRKPDHKKGK